MLIRLEHKKYLVVQLNLANLVVMGIISDTDDLQTALRQADRGKGQIVLEVPEESRTADGATLSIDTTEKVAGNPVIKLGQN